MALTLQQMAYIAFTKHLAAASQLVVRLQENIFTSLPVFNSSFLTLIGKYLSILFYLFNELTFLFLPFFSG